MIHARPLTDKEKKALTPEKPMKNKKVVEPLLPGRYGHMDAADLDKEVAKFDKEWIAETAKPLTEKDSVRDQKAKCKRGRPRIGAGAKRVRVTIESSLLRPNSGTQLLHGRFALPTTLSIFASTT